MALEGRLETLYRLRAVWAPRGEGGEDDGAWKILAAIEDLIAVYEGRARKAPHQASRY
jgi:hypothetical protein